MTSPDLSTSDLDGWLDLLAGSDEGTIKLVNLCFCLELKLVSQDVLATSKSGTLLLRRDQGEMAVFWDSQSRRL